MLIHRLATLAGLAVATLFLAAPANALTMAECSTKYNAAKDAGTLAGQTWNQFRKAQCGTAAAATTDAKPAATKAAETKATTKAAAADSTAKGLTAKECSAKYQAAKTAGTLNGMKWNDFRKTECAAGASAAADTTKPATTKAAAAAADGKGLTMAECSTKYQAAKTANTLGGKKWNDFRKSECGASASDDDSVPAPSEASYTSEPAKPTTVAPKGVTFPTAISAKYASETPGKGRMHTCLDQYYALKDANALGGLKWIQKGGGFYSLCNAKLKG
jgi:murein DD-endopeptidase MepM/ murein hydrolase activator NlpD